MIMYIYIYIHIDTLTYGHPVPFSGPHSLAPGLSWRTGRRASQLGHQMFRWDIGGRAPQHGKSEKHGWFTMVLYGFQMG